MPRYSRNKSLCDWGILEPYYSLKLMATPCLSLLRLGLQGALRTTSLAVLLDLHFAQITGFSRLKAITKIPREDTQNPNGTKMTL